jgi:hypothetical protein
MDFEAGPIPALSPPELMAQLNQSNSGSTPSEDQ